MPESVQDELRKTFRNLTAAAAASVATASELAWFVDDYVAQREAILGYQLMLDQIRMATGTGGAYTGDAPTDLRSLSTIIAEIVRHRDAAKSRSTMLARAMAGFLNAVDKHLNATCGCAGDYECIKLIRRDAQLLGDADGYTPAFVARTILAPGVVVLINGKPYAMTGATTKDGVCEPMMVDLTEEGGLDWFGDHPLTWINGEAYTPEEK
jgi:hypothetical protein